MKPSLRLVICIVALGLSACAPTKLTPTSTNGMPAMTVYYVVQEGDTLSVVAHRYHLTYLQVAHMNNIRPPYAVEAGQTLVIHLPHKTHKKSLRAAQHEAFGGETSPLILTTPTFSPQSITPTTPVAAKAPVYPSVSRQAVRMQEGNDWSWPLTGSLAQGFGQGAGVLGKGVQIEASTNAAIFAAAAGQVLFSGVGAEGYGKMLIIKSNNNFLSAYSSLSAMSVQQGQQVTRGQRIGVIGTLNGKPTLHFEVRKLGNPVDPIQYLPAPTGASS
jgi:lipoprotein NlpD